MRNTLLLLLALTAACTRRQPELASAAALHTTRCEAGRIPADIEGDWVVAQGDGFTYCVPADWKPVGTRQQRWTSSAVDLTWGEAGAFSRRAPFVVPARGQTGAEVGSRVVTETIDGATVRLEIQDGAQSSSWSAAASWLAPSLRFEAVARSASASRDVLTVIRSVRFKHSGNGGTGNEGRG